MRDKAAKYLRRAAAMNSAFDPIQYQAAQQLLAAL